MTREKNEIAFPYSDDNKRYHTLSYENRRRFGGRAMKAVIDAGFTCPNIDGTKGRGGCAFCDGGSGYFTVSGSVTEQLEREKKRIHQKYPDARIIAYFQAHSNTYAAPERLRALYLEAASRGVCEIAVATRADCIDEEKAALFSALPVPVTVELGLQTVHDKTAEQMNRGHSYADFVKAYDLLKKKNLRVCVHIIDGLPSETDEMMLETAETLGKLRPDGIKLHLLHVIRGTRLAALYERGEYEPLTRERYVDLAVRQLELFPPETVIERITGDGDKAKLLAPLWSRDKIRVLGSIDKLQRERDSFQGKKYTE